MKTSFFPLSQARGFASCALRAQSLLRRGAALLFGLSLATAASAQVVTNTFNASGNFVVPAGVNSVTVEAWGGGGGARQSTTTRRAGGGGGAYAKATVAVTPGNTYAVVVGAGGAAADPGGTGGDSYFHTGTAVLAKGGGGAPSDNTVGIGGAASASVSSDNIRFSGGDGGARGPTNGGGGGGGGSAFTNANGNPGAAGQAATGGAGGTGSGNGGNGGAPNVAGQNGNAPGGGGAGNGQGSGTSGAGAAGRVVVTYTTPVTGGPAAGIQFTTAPVNVLQGAISPVITVRLVDTNGVTAVSAGTTQINLGSGLSGTFRDAANTVNINSVTIANGQSTASFRYTSNILGARLITASDNALLLTPDSQNLVIEPKRPLVQTFYIPIPEDQMLAAFATINAAAVTPAVNRISLGVLADDTIIHYDQFENGYESDLDSPTSIYNASTNPGGTQIWGDGDTSNGAPPGIPTDLIGSGTVIVLSATVPVPIPGADIHFGGRDKVGASKAIAMVRAGWGTGSNTLLAGDTEVYDTNNWGTSYTIPVGNSIPDGTDFQMFDFCAAYIMAGRGGATVNIDADGNGTPESTVTLAEGESHATGNGLNPGSRITSDNPVQLDLITGDIGSSYESRIMRVLPVSLWSSRYINPVSTPSTAGTQTGTDTTVWLYNPGSGALSVTYQTRNTSGVLTSSTLSVPGGATGGYLKQVVPVGFGSSFTSAGNVPFYAISTTDSNNSTTGTAPNTYPGNQAWDWGYTLVPDTSLTPQVLVGLGIGRDPTSGTNPNENGNPVWVTPVGNGDTAVTVYVDYDADPATGPNTDPNGAKYDTSVSLRELDQGKLYNPAGDQTGMLVYTLSAGVKLAAAWGQDPLVASAGAPGLDMGSGIPPLPLFTASKSATLESDNDGDGFLSPGDEISYTIFISNSSRAPVSSIQLEDILPVGTVYVSNSTSFKNELNVSQGITDNVNPATPFPLDAGGVTLPQSALPVGGTWEVSFRVVLQSYGVMPPSQTEIVNAGVASAENSSVPFDSVDPFFGRIGDFVWADINSDGLQSLGEPGVSNVTVRLYNSASNLIATASTGPSGSYFFNGLSAGNYQVQFVVPSGYQFTTRNADGQGINGGANSDAIPASGRTAVFSLANGQPKLVIDAGLTCLSPTIQCPPDITIQCPASTLPANTGSPTGTSPCGCPLSFTFSDASTPVCGNARVITRTWTASDNCGSPVVCQQLITVQDNSAPVINGVGPASTVACGIPLPFSSPTASDTCDPAPGLTFVDATVPGSCPQNFVRTRTWTATDACGNASTASQAITVQDIVAPVISGVGGPATIQCDQPIVFSSPIATDACAPTPGLTFVDSTLPGSCPQSFVRTRTWTATDSCSNSSTASQSITVIDTTDPVISGVGPAATVQCDQPIVFSSPTASDNCDTTPTLTFSDATAPGACPQNFVRTRTWTATDDCGNDVTASQAITIQDTTDPVISGVGPASTLECDQPIVFSNPTAVDNCDTTPTLTFTDATAPGACPQNFVRTRTWTATDDCGNSSTASQAITVQDTTDPAISGVGGPITIECDQPIVFSSPTASDNCDTTPTLTFSDATVPGSCPQNFVRTRTWTATDDCGNSSAASQAITVQDTTDPVISGVGPAATLECDQPIVFSSPTAADNCETTPTLTFVDSTVPGTCPQNFVRTRTWTAADDCGNDVTASQSITVRDTTDPVISGVGPAATLECDQPIVFSSPTAADNCDTTPTLTFNDATVPGACPENFVRTRTWTATDDCGNSSTASQAITVQDTTDPVISGVGGPQTIECTAPLVFSTPSAADNCDTAPSLTFVDATVPGSCPNNFARTRTWTASDNCGNDSTASQTITVQDTTGPVVTCPGDTTLAGDANCRAQVPVLTATGTDACGGAVTLVQNPAPGTVLQGPGTFPVTITGTDVCGNTGSCTVQITVNCGPAAIDLQKTVYLGNNGAANCPGTELVVTVQGAPVTYCFRVQNTGTVNLSNVTVTDPTLAMPPINVGTLNVGQIQTVAFAASATTLTNVAAVVGTPPSGPNVTDSDPAEVRTYLLASVGDRVWLDGNRNGVQDPAELAGVSGATVVLYRTLGGIPVATNTTGASGAYLFPGLVPDAYFVEITLPTGYGFSPLDQGGDDTLDSDVNPGNGRTLSFILGSGQVDLTQDAGAFCQVPVVNCPSNRTLECPADTSPANTGTATATSPCGCPLNVTFVDSVTPICGNARTITRTWTATDECGNSSSCVQTITVVDTTDPVISGVGPAMTIECDQPVVFSSPSASDACDAAPALTFVDSTVPGACPQNFVRTRTWTATDDCGNDVTASQAITVQDTTDPVISGVGAAATIECDQPLVFSSPTAADNCDTTPALIFSDATVPGACPQNFVRTRTWTATDDCGNSSTASQSITVRDTADPVITGVGGPLTIECTAPIVFSSPGATDACDATPTLTFTDATVPGTCPQNFTRTRTWTATDDCGNDVTASQSITVQDSTDPVISGVGPAATISCDQPIVFSGPGATDACDPAPALTFVDSTLPGACPQNFVRTRTWTATDACGNSSTASQSITVVDSTDPVISGVGPAATVECDQPVVFSNPTASDNCDTTPSLTFTDSTVPGTCPQNFVRTRTWTATDDCGNDVTASQSVTVRDTTDPVITGVGGPATLDCTQPVVFSTPTAADVCDASPTLTFVDSTVPGACPQNFTRTRTWTATDACGNDVIASQTITVVDSTAPVISGAGPALTIECTQPVVFSAPTAADNCDTTPTLTFSDSTAPGSCPQNFVRTRTWTATDDCGNSSTASQAVTVRDTLAPVISGVGPAQTIECTAALVFSTPSASDACDTTPTLTFTDSTAPGSCPQNFVRTRTWTATDDCGNSSTASQAITVRDTVAPVFSNVGPALTIECGQSLNFSSPFATDACDTIPTLTFADSTTPGACPQNFTRTRTWTATDDCGNASTASQAITVQDTVAPVISGVGPAQTIECPQALVFSSPIADDVCDDFPTLTFVDTNAPGSCPNNFARTRTWTATDACGNASTATQTLTVQDTTGPVVNCPGNTTLGGDANCRAQVPVLTATGTDACGGAVTLVQNPAPGTVLQGPGIFPVTITGTDVCGNTGSCTVQITVNCGPAAIDLQKTVYLGNNGAANCPGTELVVTVQGAPVTYCFRVQNTGTVNLSNVTVTDPTLAMPPINVGNLNVGQIQTVAYAASANTLTNVASVVGTPPSGPNVTDSDPAEVRTYLLASVGDRVWLDGNRNGVQDPAELTGVSGATVVLYRTLGGTPVATNTTGASGAYLFSGLVPDAYFVEITLPTGYGFSPLDQGGDDTLDSDVNPGNGRTLSFILGSGQVDLTKDAGAFCQVPVVNCPSNRTLECPADTSPANTGTATATSPCGCPLNVTFVDSVTPICGNARTISRTWTATDECGNSSSCVQTITVVDTTDPVISGVGPALTIECDQPVVFSTPSAFDACDTTPALTFTDSNAPGACPQNFVRTRTWTATDDCGNDVTASQTITVRDTVAPVISGVGPAQTIECTQSPAFSSPTAADNCDTIPTLTFNDTTAPGSCPQNFVRTRTWTATDDCGNSSTASQSITVRDSTDPVISGVGGPLTLECDQPVTFSGPTASDNCDTIPTLTFVDSTAPGTCPQNFVRTRTWTATDDCGNDVTASQTITVRDTTPPVISGVGGPLLRECTDPVVFSSPGAVDVCDATPTLTFADSTAPGACPQNFVRTRTWTATDDCGNSSTASQVITVQDTLAPVISGVGPALTIDCIQSVVFSSPVANDACDLIPTLTFVDATVPGTCPQNFTRTRTWTATDDCGNSSTASQAITVRDTTPPVISGVGPAATIECDQPVVFSAPSAADNCDATPSLTFSDATVPGSCPQNFARTRTWTAADDCGNTSTASQTITVLDTTDPVISGVGPGLTVECDQPVVFSNPTASDNCDTTPALTFADSTAPGACPQNFVRTRTWTATDDCGNSSTASQSVTVRDTTNPVISGVGAAATVECDQPIVFSSPTASDNCDATPTLTFSDATVPGTCPQNFVRTRTWTATDDCGNIRTASQAVTVRDTTDPVISGVGAAQTIECDQPIIFSSPTASDNCDTTPTLTFSDATVPGTCPQNFVRIRTWTATDDCGNDVTASQSVTVRDTVAPVISGVGPAATIECDQPIVFSSPTAADNCDTTPTLTFVDSTVPGTCPQNFVRTRTWTATDDCGNVRTASQSITVRDTTNPVISGVGPATTLECDQPVVFSNPAAADNCDTTPSLTFSDDTVPGSCPENFVRTRTWTATDDCGNSSTASQAITVRDTTDPVISGVGGPQTIECTAPIVFSTPTAADNCDTTPTLTFVDATVPGSCPNNFARTRTWTAADNCGNDSTASQTITVQDTTGPVVSCPGDVTLGGDANCRAQVPVLTATGTDACGGAVTLVQNPAPGTVLQGPGTFPVTITGTDVCGNTGSCTVQITVNCGPAAIDLQKTVYLGNNGAANCPGTELVVTVQGAPVTYCFRVQNTGTVNLSNVTVTDPTLAMPPINVGTLNVGQIQTVAYAASANTLTNVASVVGTPPSGPNVTDSDPAEVRTYLLASVGDRVWLDGNRNGVQDPAELTGVSGATVVLYRTLGGTPVATNTTGASGAYLFPGLVPDAYFVEVTLPAGYGFAPLDQGGDDTLDSDVNPGNGRTLSFILGSGQVDLTQDAGAFCQVPVVNCPANRTLECPADTSPANTGTATATSPCGCPLNVTFVDSVTPICGNARTISRTWTATDECGNSSSCVQTITVVDTTDPVISGVGPALTIECDQPVVFSTPSASDACDTAPALTFLDSTVPGTCPQNFVRTRTWTATDDCGNDVTASQSVTVRDTVAPVISGVGAAATIECDQPIVFSTPTAADNCDTTPTLTFSDATVPGTCPQNFVRTRTWTATDDCGNVRTASQSITVRDTTDPVISGVGPAATIECDQPIVFSNPTASDNCDTTPTLTFSDATVPGSCPQNFVRTRTWTAIDDCGNDVTASQAITVQDTTDPVISGVGPAQTVECTAPIVFSTPTASDNCDTTPTLAFSDSTAPGACPQNFVRTRTWTATDDCGNSSTASQAVTVRDTIAPVISGVGPAQTIECDQPIVFSSPTAADACDTTPSLTFSDATVPGSCPQNFVRTRTWTATDDCGNSSTASQAVTVRDTVAPAISGVGPAQTIECTAPIVFSTPTAADNCDTTPSLTFSDATAPGACPQSFTRTRTWTAIDDCGNSSTASQAITVQDTTDPVISGVGPAQTIECTAPIVFSSPTASDNCDTTPTLTFTDATVPGTCPQNFVRTRTWLALDDCGNSSTASQAVTVRDTVAPVISGVGPAATLECDQPIVFSSPTASDNCDTTPTLSFSDATVPGSCPQNFVRTRTWIATDDCGNSTTASQTLTVRDTNAPVISGVGPAVTIECDQPIVFSSPTASDNCDTTPTLTFSDATVPGSCPQNFVRTRTWTATDDCGNIRTASQAITVQDTTDPVISGVGPASTIECDQPIVFSSPTASDNCDTTPTLTFSDATVPGSCPQNFVRTRTWTATDDCGNSSTASQAITVQDTTDPVISGVGPGQTIECTAPIVFSTPTASDNCDTTPTLTFSDATVPGSCPQNFVRTRTWTATDDCGNTSTASQSVTVRDTVAPVISGVGGPLTIECTTPINFGSPSATDNCDTTPTITFSDATVPGTCPQNFVRTRTWTATDDCGNTRTASRSITVRDTVAPAVTCPAAITIECGAPIPAANPSSVLAVDACDPTPVVTHVSDVSNGLLCPRTITRTYRATDACGNAATCTQLITVQDTTLPVQVGTLADQLVQCDGQVPPPLQPVMADACDTNLTISVQTLTQFSTVPGNCSKTILYRWTIRDDCNNTQRVNQRTIVRDRLRPVITCPPPVTITGDLNCQAAIPVLAPVVTDNCDPSPVVTQSPLAGTILGPGTHTVTITAVDICGNSQSCTTTVTIECPALPGIQILKSVYLGHDGGASCPGLEKVHGMAGAPITYCFLVINTGQVALVNVTVTDPILNLTASVGNLGVGQSATRFAETTLAQDLVNVATGTGTPPSGPPVADTDPAEVKRIVPSILIQKTVQNGAGAPCPGLELVSAVNGDPLTYCFTVTNTGDTPLRHVTVSDDLLGIPPFLVGVDGLLNPGQSVSTQLTAVANGNLLNIAEVTGYPPMGPPVSDDDPAQVVTFGPGVRFKKTVYAGNNGVAGCPGDDHLGITGATQVTYCFEVTNTGDLPLLNVVIRDPALAYTNTVGNVPVGQTVFRAVAALVSSSVTNVAVATMKPGTGSLAVTNSAAVGLYSPSLQINKKIFAGHGDAVACDTAGDNLSAPLNSPVTYCFEVVNTGDTHLNNITVFDNDLAVGDTAMEFIRGAFPLPPGQSALYTYKALVQGALVNTASALANSATPEAKRIGGLPNSTDTDSAVLQVAPPQP